MKNFQAKWKILTAVVVLLLALYLLYPSSSVMHEVPPDKSCKYNLRWIGKAIARYQKEKGPLPQSKEDSTGNRHSWRILIMPYSNSDCDFSSYRWNESWHSPHNQQIVSNGVLSVFFTCRVESDRGDYPFTSYLMLVRDQSSDSNKKPLSDKAIQIVESTGCQIKFAEPKDLNMEDLFASDSPFGVGKLNSPHPGVVRALRADGKVIDIPKDISKERLRRLLDGNLTFADTIILNPWPWYLGIGIVCVLVIGILLVIFLYSRLRKNKNQNRDEMQNNIDADEEHHDAGGL